MWIRRNSGGAVCGCFSVQQIPQEGMTDEEVTNDNPDLLAWLNPPAASKRAEIEAAYNAAVSFLKDYPQSEQMSWAAQEAEARAVIANSAAVTPTLAAIAVRTGETVPALAAKVIANADAFKAGGGDAIGRRRARMKAIAAAVAANDMAAVKAVVW